jgi:8-oxo-dGTP diphosphatase
MGMLLSLRFKMIDKKIFDTKVNFHGAKGLVFIDEKILVYRRDGRTSSFPFYIDLPGGGREQNESPFETFRREVGEEFGIAIKPEDVIYSKQYMSVIDPNMEAYFLVTKPLNITFQDVIPSYEVPKPILMDIKEYMALADAIPRHVHKVREYLDTQEIA